MDMVRQLDSRCRQMSIIWGDRQVEDRIRE